MAKYWLLIMDRDKQTFEVIGQSNDDTLLTYNASEMQRVGMNVGCQAPDVSASQNVTVTGYTEESGLYRRLFEDFEAKTGKRLKQW